MMRSVVESRMKQSWFAFGVVLFLLAIASQQASAQSNVFPSSGNVGIGTTTPSAPLDVIGNIFSTGPYTFLGRGQSTAEVNLDVGTSRTGNGYTYVDLIGDTTYTDYGTRLIRFNSGPNTDSMLTHRGTGSLRINTNEQAPITFETSATERMRIDSIGNLGIGTTSPRGLLHLGQNDGAADSVRAPLILSRYWASDSDTRAAAIFEYNNSATNQDQLVFGVTGGGGAVTSPAAYGNAKLVIQANGYVGIGTTVPAAKLDVSGDLRNSGNVSLSTSNYVATGASVQVGDGQYGLSAQGGFTRLWSASNGGFIFNVGTTEKGRIDSNGNLGIGTTAPTGIGSGYRNLVVQGGAGGSLYLTDSSSTGT